MRGDYDELEVGHSEGAGGCYGVFFEAAGYNRDGGLSRLLDFDHVVDHPRRAGPSIGCRADYDVAFAGGLLDDGGRRGVVAAGVEVDGDVFEAFLEHFAGTL